MQRNHAETMNDLRALRTLRHRRIRAAEEAAKPADDSMELDVVWDAGDGCPAQAERLATKRAQQTRIDRLRVELAALQQQRMADRQDLARRVADLQSRMQVTERADLEAPALRDRSPQWMLGAAALAVLALVFARPADPPALSLGASAIATDAPMAGLETDAKADATLGAPGPAVVVTDIDAVTAAPAATRKGRAAPVPPVPRVPPAASPQVVPRETAAGTEREVDSHGTKASATGPSAVSRDDRSARKPATTKKPAKAAANAKRSARKPVRRAPEKAKPAPQDGLVGIDDCGDDPLCGL